MVSLVHLKDRKSHSNTTLVKVKQLWDQILLVLATYSNTTLVKVKSIYNPISIFFVNYSNTTLVKVKFRKGAFITSFAEFKYNSC